MCVLLLYVLCAWCVCVLYMLSPVCMCVVVMYFEGGQTFNKAIEDPRPVSISSALQTAQARLDLFHIVPACKMAHYCGPRFGSLR